MNIIILVWVKCARTTWNQGAAPTLTKSKTSSELDNKGVNKRRQITEIPVTKCFREYNWKGTVAIKWRVQKAEYSSTFFR